MRLYVVSQNPKIIFPLAWQLYTSLFIFNILIWEINTPYL